LKNLASHYSNVSPQSGGSGNSGFGNNGFGNNGFGNNGFGNNGFGNNGFGNNGFGNTGTTGGGVQTPSVSNPLTNSLFNQISNAINNAAQTVGNNLRNFGSTGQTGGGFFNGGAGGAGGGFAGFPPIQLNGAVDPAADVYEDFSNVVNPNPVITPTINARGITSIANAITAAKDCDTFGIQSFIEPGTSSRIQVNDRLLLNSTTPITESSLLFCF
jgi:hypothetical protein